MEVARNAQRPVFKALREFGLTRQHPEILIWVGTHNNCPLIIVIQSNNIVAAIKWWEERDLQRPHILCLDELRFANRFPNLCLGRIIARIHNPDRAVTIKRILGRCVSHSAFEAVLDATKFIPRAKIAVCIEIADRDNSSLSVDRFGVTGTANQGNERNQSEYSIFHGATYCYLLRTN